MLLSQLLLWRRCQCMCFRLPKHTPHICARTMLGATTYISRVHACTHNIYMYGSSSGTQCMFLTNMLAYTTYISMDHALCHNIDFELPCSHRADKFLWRSVAIPYYSLRSSSAESKTFSDAHQSTQPTRRKCISHHFHDS